MFRYNVAHVLSEEREYEVLTNRFVKAVIGRVQLLRRLSFKREFFVPFIPTKQILFIFPTCNPLNGLIVREETLAAVSRYLRWLTDTCSQRFSVLEFLVCTISGCVVVTIDCFDVLSALEVHSLSQEAAAPSIGNRRVLSFPCDMDKVQEECLEFQYYIVPTCTICAERLEPTLTGYGSRTCCCAPEKECRCFLEHSSCIVCQMLIKMQRGSNAVQCKECSLSGDPWICLVCGFVGCSRYQKMHARDHFLQQQHLFSMSLLTQQIWDYDSDAFVHRVVVVLDVATGVTHRVQYPNRDDISSLLEDDVSCPFAETVKKKHINAKYDSKVETSNEQLALMIKNQLDLHRAECESEQQKQKYTHCNDNDDFSVYNAMCVEETHSAHRKRWLSLFLANKSLRDELMQRRRDEVALGDELNGLDAELQNVIHDSVMQDHRLTDDIADIQETIKEVEMNVLMRKQLADRLGEGDTCQRIYVVGESTAKSGSGKQPNRPSRKSSGRK